MYTYGKHCIKYFVVFTCICQAILPEKSERCFLAQVNTYGNNTFYKNETITHKCVLL